MLDLAGVEKTLDLRSHEKCLIQLITGGIDSSARPLSIAGPGFASTLEGRRKGIAQGDDDTGRAVVLVQRKYSSVRVLQRKIEQDSRVRSSEPVHRLPWVANDRQIVMMRHNLA